MRSRQRNRLRLPLVAGLVIGALIVASCGDDDDEGAISETTEPTETEQTETAEESSEWEALLEDARSEGSVVVYASTNPQTLENLEEAFEEAYPDISLDFLRESSAVIEERVAGERDAGSVGGDVVMTSNRFWAEGEHEEGGATPVTVVSPQSESYEDECVADEGYAIAGTDTVGIVYNPSLVENPQALGDFVGIDGGVADPATSAVPIFLYDTFGWDWLEAVAASDADITINPGAPDTIAAVGAGEQAWGVANSTQVVPVREEGSPIELFVPDPAPGFIIPAVALSDAPHPAAAQVLLNFIISQEGQQSILANGAGVSCRDDVPTALETPDDLALFSAEHVSEEFLAEGKARFDELSEMFG